jgi:hypothetical protein
MSLDMGPGMGPGMVWICVWVVVGTVLGLSGEAEFMGVTDAF